MPGYAGVCMSKSVFLGALRTARNAQVRGSKPRGGSTSTSALKCPQADAVRLPCEPVRQGVCHEAASWQYEAGLSKGRTESQ